MKLFILLLAVFTLQISAQAAETKPDPKHIVKIGDTAPDFTIKLVDGTNIKLSSLRGKIVMLQFTASWCSVCRKEMPFIEKEIYKVNKSNSNFAIFGIDLKESAEIIQKFQSATGVSYPIALDEDGKIFELYAEKDAGVTRNIIIDKQGKIVFLTRLFDREEFNKMKSIISDLLSK